MSQRTGCNTRVPVALVDMDETLCDYSGALARELAKIRGPHDDRSLEQILHPPAYVEARRRLVASVPGFWRNLQPLQLGFQIVGVLTDLGFDLHILTKGPRHNPLAWMEKVEWCRKYVPQIPIAIAEDKGIVRGDVLVEDWPPYIARWLARCPAGLVIVPAQQWNGNVELDFSGSTIRYDGTNLKSVRERLVLVRQAVSQDDSSVP